jgi:hypothetical protein
MTSDDIYGGLRLPLEPDPILVDWDAVLARILLASQDDQDDDDR